mmetsp:Transcript_18030/g.51286  ORF Transcript_18030/g.51286 Transcript_18030/m.51286 type:complete len:230 (-) Transcript_18030:1069-1758(-)
MMTCGKRACSTIAVFSSCGSSCGSCSWRTPSFTDALQPLLQMATEMAMARATPQPPPSPLSSQRPSQSPPTSAQPTHGSTRAVPCWQSSAGGIWASHRPGEWAICCSTSRKRKRGGEGRASRRSTGRLLPVTSPCVRGAWHGCTRWRGRQRRRKRATSCCCRQLGPMSLDHASMVTVRPTCPSCHGHTATSKSPLPGSSAAWWIACWPSGAVGRSTTQRPRPQTSAPRA